MPQELYPNGNPDKEHTGHTFVLQMLHLASRSVLFYAGVGKAKQFLIKISNKQETESHHFNIKENDLIKCTFNDKSKPSSC